MRVYVKGLTGVVHTLEMKEGADTSVLRQRLEELEGIPGEQLVLLYAGQELQDGACLRDYGLGKYNTEGDAMIYLQTRLAEPVHIYLAIPSSSRPRICEVVEADLPLEEVLRLLWAHGLMEKFDPENCRVIARRDDSSSIAKARFDLSHSVHHVMRSVGKLEGVDVTVATFMSAPDGNLQVVCSPTEKKYENTHTPFERPHRVPILSRRAGLDASKASAVAQAGERARRNSAGATTAVTAAAARAEEMETSWAHLRRELCIRE